MSKNFKTREPQIIISKNENDIGLFRISKGAIFNNTTLPSGLITPPFDMVSNGQCLIEAIKEVTK